MAVKSQGGAIVWFTLLLALFLEVMPLPEWFQAFRPNWLLVVLSYWALAIPQRYGVLTACGLGIFLDVLLGATIGSRGLALSIIIYLIALNYQRIRNFMIWQQIGMIGMASLFYFLTLYWIQYILSSVPFQPMMLLSVVSTMVIWPWMYWLLRQIRRRFKVK